MNAPEAKPASSEPVVTLERLPRHVGLVTLNRPEARNAINGDVARALEAIVAEVEADPGIRAVVLAGAGGAVFCAGADLKEVAAGRAAELFTACNGFAGFVHAQRSKPWIAAVHGKALAGGCEIALACELIVAAQDAAFGLPEVSRGLIAAAGGLYRLPRALPRNLALELVMTAEPIDAVRAERHGLVNRLAPPQQVVADAIELAERITRNAPIAVCESLRVARQAHELVEAALRALTKEARDRVAATDDYREGPRAFIEKREPRWSGR
jgi:enoyl-CoA hydratase